MKTVVHILVTVRNPALVDAALLVFKTLRTGFPNARVQVHGNGLGWCYGQELEAACKSVGAVLHGQTREAHDQWVERLIAGSPEPFWICDTDVVFFGSMETTIQPGVDELVGRLEPEFMEEFTRTRHVERLHTACLYIDPAKVRAKMRAWAGQFPEPWGATAQVNLVRQQFIPRQSGIPLFYDTCAGLWHAGIGRPLDSEADSRFEHLHCGTYVDLAGKRPGLKDLQAVHKQIYARPELARGLHKQQAKYYASRAPGHWRDGQNEKGQVYAV